MLHPPVCSLPRLSPRLAPSSAVGVRATATPYSRSVGCDRDELLREERAGASCWDSWSTKCRLPSRDPPRLRSFWWRLLWLCEEAVDEASEAAEEERFLFCFMY